MTTLQESTLSEEWKAPGKTELLVKIVVHTYRLESVVNASEIHGLDKCPDHGVAGFNLKTAFGWSGRCGDQDARQGAMRPQGRRLQDKQHRIRAGAILRYTSYRPHHFGE